MSDVAMTDAPSDDQVLARYLDTSAALLGLRVDPAWQDNVLGYFMGMAAAARLVDEFALPDEAEPAPVFTA